MNRLVRQAAQWALLVMICVLIWPALAGRIASAQAADAIANARTAALLDPEGESLARCLADIESRSMSRIAAE